MTSGGASAVRAAIARSWLGDPNATTSTFTPTPWTGPDLRRLVILAGSGSIALVVGWVFTARRAAVDDQLPWLNLAVIGCLVAGMANATFLLRGYRAVRHRRRWLLARQTLTPSSDGPVSAELVAIPSMTRYHRPNCPYVAGKDDALVALPADEHEAAGRTRCPWCTP